jgi:hypothetical protein
MGMCGGGGDVSVPAKSQEELDLMAAQKKQLDAQALQLAADKKDRELLEPMVLKSMKLNKIVDASGNPIAYENIQALLDKNAPVTRENLNPAYFADDNEKDAFILSAESMDREKKAAAGTLPIPASVEQNLGEQKTNLLQNLNERYGKRYLESTGGSKGLLGFEANAADLREKIRTGKATEASDITKGLVSNYLRPQGYGYELYNPNMGLVGSISNALTPYSQNAASGYQDNYMSGYTSAANKAGWYNMLGTAGGMTAAAYMGSSGSRTSTPRTAVSAGRY